MSTDYFSKALSNFTNDIASGDAIRHLADLGYTVNEIRERLDFPTPASRIADTVWKHFTDTGVIRLSEPDGRPVERISYVREYDSLGRAFFKQVKETVVPQGLGPSRRIGTGPGDDPGVKGDPGDSGNGSMRYIPVDFGIRKYRDPAGFEKSLKCLEQRDRDYIFSLPWPVGRVWHIADERMERITGRLAKEEKDEDHSRS